MDINRVGQSTSAPLYRWFIVVVGVGVLGQWLGGRPVNPRLVSVWVRAPSTTAEHFHSPPVVGHWVIKGVGWTQYG